VSHKKAGGEIHVELQTNMSKRAQAVAQVKLETPRVRITEYRFAPQAETGWHRHGYDYLVVPLTSGRLLLEQPDGSKQSAQLQLHQPYARPVGVEHNVINDNDFELAFLEVELLS
jgi:quercetin dioxygenase-like cupin family protein